MPSGLWDLSSLIRINLGPSSEDPGSQLKCFSWGWASPQPSLALGLSRIHLPWLTHSLEHGQEDRGLVPKQVRKVVSLTWCFLTLLSRDTCFCLGAQLSLSLLWAWCSCNYLWTFFPFTGFLDITFLTWKSHTISIHFSSAFRAYKVFSCAVP